mgnify:CR=1 FL=1
MVDTVNDFEGTRPDVPNVAAICSIPYSWKRLSRHLPHKRLRSRRLPEVSFLTDIYGSQDRRNGMAVMRRTDEIDVVMNLGYFMEDNFEELTEELQEIKESCRHAHLKVILETGALVTAENIQKASILAMYSGADFIKTSTGKGYPGATFEAAYTMCKAIKPTIHHRK